MKVSSFRKALDQYLNPVKYMKLKYPKAAKRRRIQNKWRNRFGIDASELMLEAYSSPNAFLASIPKDNFSGGHYLMPSAMSSL